MTELHCSYHNCIHQDFLSGLCLLEAASVEEIECGDCYEPVSEQADYQTEYWIHCMVKGIEYKKKKKGKRIEVDGVVLYTEDKLPPENEWSNPEFRIAVTEEKTGMLLSLHRLYIPECRKRIDEYIKNAVPLSEIKEMEEEAECF